MNLLGFLKRPRPTAVTVTAGGKLTSPYGDMCDTCGKPKIETMEPTAYATLEARLGHDPRSLQTVCHCGD